MGTGVDSTFARGHVFSIHLLYTYTLVLYMYVYRNVYIYMHACMQHIAEAGRWSAHAYSEEDGTHGRERERGGERREGVLLSLAGWIWKGPVRWTHYPGNI